MLLYAGFAVEPTSHSGQVDRCPPRRDILIGPMGRGRSMEDATMSTESGQVQPWTWSRRSADRCAHLIVRQTWASTGAAGQGRDFRLRRYEHLSQLLNSGAVDKLFGSGNPTYLNDVRDGTI